MRAPRPRVNSKEQIHGFHRRMKALARTLALKQGMAVGAKHQFPPIVMKRHSCEKAIAPQFRKEGDCAECQYEQSVSARLTLILGPSAGAKQ